MTVQTAPTLKPYVLRILNGPLQGCEFPLGKGSTLFVVGPVDLLGEQALSASVPAEAIFVPLESAGCNFEVLGDQATPDGLPLRLLGESVQVLECAFQTKMRIAGLHIALRPDDQSWAPELLGQSHDAAGDAPVFVNWRKPWCRWAAGGLAGAALVVAAGLWWTPAPAPESNVLALIRGANVQVLRGRDDRVYVFAASERDADWSRQVLSRDTAVGGEVLIQDQERRRLEQLLVEHDPQLAWHYLDLKDPTLPRLVLSRQRNLLTPARQAKLLDALRAAAPYAGEIEVQIQDDGLLADLAQAGLQRLSLGFRRVEHPDSVTFAIEGDLQDSELAAARQYVSHFYRQWGDRYVHFSVGLKDDALKGKSFQTGPQGYVKTGSSSWHFLNQTE